jgi:hypothetical protein
LLKWDSGDFLVEWIDLGVRDDRENVIKKSTTTLRK